MSDLLDATVAGLTASRCQDAAVAVTNIPSPTGYEASLARWLADAMAGGGIESHVQHLDENQANAVGRIRGTSDGPDVMLYAPIDTFTTGRAEIDVPWIGPELRADMVAHAEVSDGEVRGLGASNPKGHAAVILVTALAYAEALRQSDTKPAGDLVIAFGAGGMPTNAIDPPPARANTGHGVGASFLLERGWHTDAAIIAKPGDFVAFEEVGLCWFEITVHGNHTYVGSRHRLPYRNPIVDMAALIGRLEQWLAEYPARHRTATALPQGVIGSIAGGWERMLAATPAACRIRLDIRIAPGVRPIDTKHELVAAVRAIGDDLGIDADVELVNAIPGSSTPLDSWIVERTIEAWERVNGRTHEPVPDNSGATDANILRNRGIATARVGMPKAAAASSDFSLGMNLVEVGAMQRLGRILADAVVNTVGPDAPRTDRESAT